MTVSNDESIIGLGGGHSDPLTCLADFAREALRQMDTKESVEFVFGQRRFSMPLHEARIAFYRLDKLLGNLINQDRK